MAESKVNSPAERDAIESEASESVVESEESKLADLRLAATERYRELTGDDKAKADKFLGTKAILELTPEKLTEFLKKFGG